LPQQLHRAAARRLPRPQWSLPPLLRVAAAESETDGPFGVFVYLIARGHKMAQRDAVATKAPDQAIKAYVQDAASSGGSADELAELAEQKNNGVITDTEFADQKPKILA
jgi:hypothetical protein